MDDRRDLDERDAEQLGKLMRGEAEPASPEHLYSEWHRLLRASEGVDRKRLRGRRVRWLWVVLPAAASAAVLAVVLLGHAPGARPLQFRVDGAEPLQNYLSADAQAPRHIEFSDGSSVTLRPAGRMRITGTHAHGAGVLLECGRADLSIRHRPSTRWRVDAGPYTVSVTGTRFTVAWDPDTGDFGLRLAEGGVEVGGPGISPPIAVSMGQEIHATRAGTLTITQAAPLSAQLSPPAPEEKPTEAPLPAHTGRKTGSEHPSGGPAPEGRNDCDWTALVSSGEFETIVARARALGFRTALAECPTKSLFALADAARYLGRFDLSSRTLQAVSKRSPEDAIKAAFFLGRLEEARGNLRQASAFYGKVIEGSRDSNYVREANDGMARIGDLVHPSEPSRSPR